MKEDVIKGVTGSFTVAASVFLQEAIGQMAVWFMVGASVVLCDLIAGIRCSYLMGERIRPSRAIRETMGKMITYFAFVIMVCMVSVAAGSDYRIEKWACLLVYGIEFLSIIGNILRPKGYTINFSKLFGAVFGKTLGGTKSDYEDILEKNENSKV